MQATNSVATGSRDNFAVLSVHTGFAVQCEERLKVSSVLLKCFKIRTK